LLPQGTSCSAKSLEETGSEFAFRSHVGFQLRHRRSMGYTMERNFLFSLPSRWLAIVLWLVPSLPLLADTPTTKPPASKSTTAKSTTAPPRAANPPTANPSADRQHAVAAAHYAQGEWELAAEAFQQFRTQFPRDHRAPAADYFRAESLVQAHQYEPALEVLEQFLQLHPDHPQSLRARFRAGEIAYRLGRFTTAQQHLSEYRQQATGHELEAFAIPHLAAMALDRGDAEGAASLYAEALRAFPRGPLAAESRLGLATAQETLGNLVEAERFYRVATLSKETLVATQAGLRLARLLTKQGEFDSALEHLQLVASQTDDPRLAPHIALWTGRAYQGRGEAEQAARTWWESVEKSPGSELAPQLAHQAATTFRQLDQSAEAETAFRWLTHSVMATTTGTVRSMASSSSSAMLPSMSPSVSASRGNVASPDTASATTTTDTTSPSAEKEEPPSLPTNSIPSIHPWHEESLVALLEMQLDAPNSLDSAKLLGDWQQLVIHHPRSRHGLPLIQRLGHVLLRSHQSDQLLRALDEFTCHRSPENSAESSRVAYLYALAYWSQGNHASAWEQLRKLQSEGEDHLPEDLRSGFLQLRASCLFALGHFEEVIPLLKQELQQELEQKKDLNESKKSRALPQRHLRLALALVKVGRLDEADQTLEYVWRHADPTSVDSTADGKTEGPAQIALHLAELAYAAGNYPVAERQFGRVAEHAEQSGETQLQMTARLGQAWANLRQGDYARAERTLDRWVTGADQEPDSSEAGETLAEMYFLLGRVLERQSRPEEAIRAHGRVSELHAESPFAADALFAQGRLLDRQGRHREACQTLGRLVTEHPRFAQADTARYLQAWNLVELGADQEADAVFSDIRDLHPSSEYWPDAMYRLAERAARRDDRNQASQLVDELLLRAPNSELAPQALYLRGQMSAEEKRWDDLQRDMQRMVIQYPEHPLQVAAAYWLAEAHYHQGRYSLSADEFEKLAAVTESRQEAWIAMILLRWSQSLAHQNQWDAAQQVAASISDRFPQFSQQHEADYVIGRALVHEARLGKAREAFERVTSSATGRGTETAAMAQWMIGETYFHQRNFRAATQAYLGAETLYNYPRWRAASRLQLGKCYEAQQNWDSAIRYYKLVIDGREDPQLIAEAERRYSELRQRESNPRSAFRLIAPR
jgi:cellulose synthase operon protein C